MRSHISTLAVLLTTHGTYLFSQQWHENTNISFNPPPQKLFLASDEIKRRKTFFLFFFSEERNSLQIRHRFHVDIKEISVLKEVSLDYCRGKNDITDLEFKINHFILQNVNAERKRSVRMLEVRDHHSLGFNASKFQVSLIRVYSWRQFRTSCSQ